jgi:hypothetical protein
MTSLTCKETDTGDENGAHMVPAERRLVDLREGETTTLVGVGDVSVVVVEVVEGSVASFGSGSHFEGCDTVGCSLSVMSVERKKRRNARYKADTWQKAWARKRTIKLTAYGRSLI